MPTYATTVKYALRCLTGTNVVSDVDAGLQALADDIDGKMATYSQGLLSARPTSTAGTPGIVGRAYYATDIGLEFHDYGTGWAPVGLALGAGFDWYGASDPCLEIMICDGRAISRTTYAGLFTQLGTTYGVGNGSTTFNLPSTADATLVGVSGTILRGGTGGEKTHVLTTSELPTHTHDAGAHYLTDGGASGTHYAYGSAGATSADIGIVNAPAAGSGTAHQNMPPYLGAYKVIRVL